MSRVSPDAVSDRYAFWQLISTMASYGSYRRGSVFHSVVFGIFFDSLSKVSLFFFQSCVGVLLLGCS